MVFASLTDVVRGLALAAVLALTVALLALLPEPGLRASRVVLFAAILAAAYAGAYGVLRHWSGVTAGSAVVLLGLGFWQFVIGIYVLPTALLLLVAAAANRDDQDGNPVPA